MHKSRLGNLVIDCPTDDLLGAARFWSSALGCSLPSDIDPEGKFIQLETKPGDVQVIVQRVEHEARVHLDVETNSIEAEVARLEALGAHVVTRPGEWVVMQAPSGHRFCVGRPFRAGFDEAAHVWPHAG